MGEKRKRFLDKILNWFVDDTVIDRENRTWFPTFLDNLDLFDYYLNPIDISKLSLYPITRFYDYCWETYDLSGEEIEYLWGKYTIIIIDKFNNEKPLNESEDKLEKYFNYVTDDLVKRTKHWRHPGNPLHVGVMFPFYYDEIDFYYDEYELEEWLHRGWLVGTDDIKYLMSNYGLTEDECSRVMDMYGIKLATLLISEYGKQ